MGGGLTKKKCARHLAVFSEAKGTGKRFGQVKYLQSEGKGEKGRVRRINYAWLHFLFFVEVGLESRKKEKRGK